MSNTVKRLIVLLISVALVMGIPASAVSAVNIPEPTVGEGQESTGVVGLEDAEASTSIDILVYGTLEITSQTEDCLIDEGTDLDLMITVSGVGPFEYQWEVSADGGKTWDTPDGAANSDTYQIIDAVLNEVGGEEQPYIYRVTVTDRLGNTVSTEIEIGVEESVVYRRILDPEDDVAVSAWMLRSTELYCEELDEDSAAYEELYRNLTPGCLPISTVDVALYNEKVSEGYFIGEQVVEFIVGEEYEGQTLRVIQLIDGEIVEHTGTVVNGILEITVDTLSQFMVEAPSADSSVVTITTGEGGTASPSGQYTVLNGSDLEVIFLPDAGYIIDEVLVDGEKVSVRGNSYVLEDIKSDHTVEVTFEKVEESDETHLVYVGVIGGLGDTSPSGYFSVKHGESLVVNLLPAPGYVVDRVVINGNIYYEAIGNFLTLSAVVQETRIEVVYRRGEEDTVAVTRTITATAGEGGSISPAGDTQIGYGGDANFYIIPDEGYVIDEVFIDGVKSSDVDGHYHFINVVDDHTIHVTFKEGDTPAGTYYTVTTESGGNGTISPAGEIIVPEGADQTFYFVPKSGYVVRAVYVNGELVATHGLSYTLKDISGDTVIRVEFAPVALIPTGDITPEMDMTWCWVMLGVAGGIAVLMIILIIVRRKKDDEEENGEAEVSGHMNE